MSNVYSSEHIGIAPVMLGDQSGLLRVGDDEIAISEDIIELSPRHVDQLSSFAMFAAESFGDSKGRKEATLAQEKFGVPTLVARVDATISRAGDIVPYEMEDVPAGQGISHLVNEEVTGVGLRDDILDHYDSLIGGTPMVIVSSERDEGSDDKIIVGDKYIFDDGTMPLPDTKQPVVVRSFPGDVSSYKKYLGLRAQSVAPIETGGDKSYLARLGMLQDVNDSRDLLIDSEGKFISQALKARMGAKATGVALYLEAEDRRRFAAEGVVTEQELLSHMSVYQEERGGALTQPFYPPIEIKNRENRQNAILRVFVLLGGHASAQVIGGCYVARKSLIIHGTPDAVVGVVAVDRTK